MGMGDMDQFTVNPSFSMQFDTTSGHKLYLDIAEGQAQCILVLTSSPDGVMAIYLCKSVNLAHRKIRKRSDFTAWCAAWWNAIIAACAFRSFKKLSPSG